jgi:hypothetical protein
MGLFLAICKILLLAWFMHLDLCCRNLNFGLTTKARACKATSQEGSLGVTSRAPRNAKECEE